LNGKWFIIPILALCLVVSFSDLCVGEDQQSALTVNKIAFTSDKIGGEWVSLRCNQPCIPELFSLDGENPRVVIDMKGVSLIQTKNRHINTGGKLVKRIRNYLDQQTKTLRIVLDMEPSKSCFVRPSHAPPENAYVLMIYEDTALSKQKPGGSEDVKESLLSKEKHITILDPDPRPGEQKRNLKEAATRPENPSAAKTAENAQSLLAQGKSQLNDGEFAEAIETFTLILAAHPQDSLIYRLRGNAYDNLGDRQKAVEDWTQAARLGDTTLQSYLDFLQVKWQENLTPAHPKGVRVIGNRDSKRYHLPGMKYHDKVKTYHRIVFQSEEEAIQAGYHRAKE
jgi:tetratricopeptide (TPR) repeat protein